MPIPTVKNLIKIGRSKNFFIFSSVMNTNELSANRFIFMRGKIIVKAMMPESFYLLKQEFHKQWPH